MFILSEISIDDVIPFSAAKKSGLNNLKQALIKISKNNSNFSVTDTGSSAKIHGIVNDVVKAYHS